MWAWGVAVGLVIFVVGGLPCVLAIMDARSFGAMLPDIVLAALGFAVFWGFLIWGLAVRRRTPEK
jgi:hypothetical protein